MPPTADHAPVLAPADLPAGAGRLDLDADGRPTAPLAFVDLTARVDDDAVAAAALADRVLVGVCDGLLPERARPLAEALATTLATADAGPLAVTVTDLDAAVQRLRTSVLAHPTAAVAAADLLAVTDQLPVRAGLRAESFAYSTLLAGPEFAAWRSSRPRRPTATGDAVRVHRTGDVLHIELDRPERRNAFGHAMRDGVVDALGIAVVDAGIREVVLTGRGPSFCSGGDLDEFATAPDVATAHLVRTRRSAAELVHRCRDRVRVVVQGACVGAGVEISSFAGRVEARDDAWFQLPELRMGLIPGAGGTVGLPLRIGRWRTTWMALAGEPVDVGTALRWGLVDARADA